MIHRIVQSAFSFDAAAGGMFGALVSKAMMMGIKRGLFSNEAGMDLRLIRLQQLTLSIQLAKV